MSQKLSSVSTGSKCYISLFMIINDPDATAEQLCEDLDKINEWAFSWKWVLILTHINKHKLFYL